MSISWRQRINDNKCFVVNNSVWTTKFVRHLAGYDQVISELKQEHLDTRLAFSIRPMQTRKAMKSGAMHILRLAEGTLFGLVG